VTSVYWRQTRTERCAKSTWRPVPRAGNPLVRACVQRVRHAEVRIDGQIVGQIERGLLVLLGVAQGDSELDADSLADKIAGLRVFDDGAGRMNLDLAAAGGAMLVVSQFTLLGDCRQGRRPSFTEAAPPEQAEELYLRFVASVRALGLTVETGRFRRQMNVALENDGPVTLLLDSRRLF
jgi:D-aminoacyl-tRNA deacylase